MKQIKNMKKSKLIALVLIFISAYCISLPINAKEVELNCKTQKGKNVTYLINKNSQSVKNGEDGSNYEVLLFSPTKLVFKKEIKIDLGENYFHSTFTYSINRNNLSYQVNQSNYTNIKDLPKEEKEDAVYNGKCSIVPRKPVAF
jgi:hypothetical protein